MQNADGLGQKFGETYSLILTDPTFERRLKQFDPNLKLMFDQNRKRWCILEWAPDQSGWNLLITAQDDKGEAKPLGEWVFNKLYVWRHNYELRAKNPNQFFDDLMWKADWQKNTIETQISLDHQHLLSQERNEWRKAWKEINNLPKSDVTAGYPKINYNKGEIICP